MKVKLIKEPSDSVYDASRVTVEYTANCIEDHQPHIDTFIASCYKNKSGIVRVSEGVDDEQTEVSAGTHMNAYWACLQYTKFGILDGIMYCYSKEEAIRTATKGRYRKIALITIDEIQEIK